jgi:hypothetical protein
MDIRESIKKMRDKYRSKFHIDSPSITVLDEENCIWKCGIILDEELHYLIVREESDIILTQTAINEIANGEITKAFSTIAARVTLNSIKKESNTCQVHQDVIYELNRIRTDTKPAEHYERDIQKILTRINELHLDGHEYQSSKINFDRERYSKVITLIATLIYSAKECGLRIEFDHENDEYREG